MAKGWIIAAAGLAVVIVRAGLGAEGVVMRPGFEAPPGRVVGVDGSGVGVSEGGKGSGVAIPWDRVWRLEGARAGEMGPFAGLAERCWRARSRWERGDAVAAEVVFEGLMASGEAGERGATAALIAEGLLRCRVRRGAQASAVEPWLAWVRATDSTERRAWLEDTGASPGVSGVLDVETGLSPMLPPIWVDSSAVRVLGGEGPSDEASWSGLGKAAALERLYRLSARVECGAAREEEWGKVPVKHADVAVALAARIVLSRAGDAGQREKARELLREVVASRPAVWMEAWCHAAIGRSLLREEDPEKRLMGVAELLVVPARMPRAVPYVTGVALAESAVELKRRGDGAGAALLKRDLVEQFVGHPGLEWEAVRAIGGVEGRGASGKK